MHDFLNDLPLYGITAAVLILAAILGLILLFVCCTKPYREPR